MDAVSVRLNEVAEVSTGVAALNSTTGMHCYSLFQPNNFSDSGMACDLRQMYCENAISEQQQLHSGDILVKRLNPSYVYIVTAEDTPAVASTNLLVIRPGVQVFPPYLGYLLEQKETLSQIEHITGSAAAIKAISVKKLESLTIPIVAMDLQNKIGALWQLGKKRKQLLQQYSDENDRIISALSNLVLYNGGKNNGHSF